MQPNLRKTASPMCLALIAIGSALWAQEPIGDGSIIAPRTDYYTQFSDGYSNPAAFGQQFSPLPNESSTLWKNRCTWQFYAGGDFMAMGRTTPSNQPLVLQTGVFTDRDRPILLATDNVDYSGARDGWRVRVGVQFDDIDAFEVAFHQWSGMPPKTAAFANSATVGGISVLTTTNPFGAATARLLEAASYTFEEGQPWGVDALWRHELKDYEWLEWSNWRMKTLAGIRVFHRREIGTYRIQTTGGSVDPSSNFIDIINVANTQVGPQVGLNALYDLCSFAEFNLQGKGGYMATFGDVRHQFFREDRIGINDAFTREASFTSGIVEILLAINWHPHPNIKITTGFEFVWLMGVSTATENLSVQLPDTVSGTNLRRPSHRDDVFYSGYTVGGEIKF